MMNRHLTMMLTLVMLVVLAGCCPMRPCKTEDGKPCCVKSATLERADVLYTCDCGDSCQCNSVSTTPGECRCGKQLAWGHVVKVEGSEALVCSCAEGCNCQLDPDNPQKCACGKPLKRVELSGTEMYFCNCGGSCMCNTLSNAPGNCKCGMPLKQH